MGLFETVGELASREGGEAVVEEDKEGEEGRGCDERVVTGREKSGCCCGLKLAGEKWYME